MILALLLAGGGREEPGLARPAGDLDGDLAAEVLRQEIAEQGRSRPAALGRVEGLDLDVRLSKQALSLTGEHARLYFWLIRIHRSIAFAVLDGGCDRRGGADRRSDLGLVEVAEELGETGR